MSDGSFGAQASGDAAARGPLFPSEKEACAAAHRLAEQAALWHAAGLWHGAIVGQTVLREGSDIPRLSDPGSTVSLGDSTDDWQHLPSELHGMLPCELSTDVSLAQARFQEAGVDLDPREIDVHALGTLLCRWLTSQTVAAYVRSPRVKRLVPGGLQPVLERMLGLGSRGRYRDAGHLVEALGAIAASSPTEMLSDLRPVQRTSVHPASSAPAPRRPIGAEDTTNSFAKPAELIDDTSTGLSQSVPPTPAESEATELPFASLGHYELIRRIGRGGMGDVYLGYERTLDRHVAIKVLAAQLARSGDFVRRFRSEATAVARLVHTNIVPIYFIGEEAGEHYYVMQFVEGESLAELLTRRGRLSLEEAWPIIDQMLAGLAAVHEHGMVHRDIKPGNILLDRRSQRAMLADFGLVKSLESSVEGGTATGIVVGTVEYISPEQGRGLNVDVRSDLYSLGVLFYRMLSGTLPFAATSPTALIFLHVYEPPPRLRNLVPEIPESLEAVVNRLLAKSPADRYASVAELQADLQAVWSNQPVASETLSRTQAAFRKGSPQSAVQTEAASIDIAPQAERVDAPKAREQRTGHARALRVIAAVIGVSLLLFAAVVWWSPSQRPQSPAPELLQSAREPTVAEPVPQPTAESETTEQTSEDPPPEEVKSNEPSPVAVEQPPQPTGPISGLTLLPKQDGDRFECFLTADADGSASLFEIDPETGVRLRHRLPAHTLKATCVAGSPNGKLAAVGGEDGLISLWNPWERRELWKMQGHAKKVTAIAFSDDGNRLLSGGSDETLRVWDLRAKVELQRVGPSLWTSPPMSVAWSASGRQAMLGLDQHGGKSLRFFELPRDREPVSFPLNRPVKSVAVSPDGALVCCHAPEEIVVYDATTGRELRHFGLKVKVAAIMHDTQRVLTIGPDPERPPPAHFDYWQKIAWANANTIAIPWDVRTGTPGEAISMVDGPAAASLSRDGLRAIVAGEGGTWQHLQLPPLPTPQGQLRQISNDTPVRSLAYASDGQYIAWGNGRDARIWVLAEQNTARACRLATPVSAVAFSKALDRVMFATAQADSKANFVALRIHTRDPATFFNRSHIDVQRFGTESPPYVAARFTPDEQHVITADVAGAIRVWEPKTERPVRTLELPFPIQDLAVLPDGKRVLIIGQDKYLRVWDWTSEAEPLVWKGPVYRPLCAAISPEGHLAAVGSSDHTIYLWNPEDGTSRGALSGHTGPVNAVGFSPDGRRLVSGSDDRTVRWWDIESETQLLQFEGHVGAVRAVAVAPSANQAASGGEDGSVRIWNVEPASAQ